MGFPDPQFGVPLSIDEIPNELPFFPQYGVTPSNKYIPISITETGEINVAGVSVIGPVEITGVDPADGNSRHDLAVVNWSLSGGGYALRTSIFYENTPLKINLDGSADVRVVNLPPNAAKETGGNLDAINAGLQALNSLVPSKYDYIDLDYTGANLTQAKFYLGGPSGTLISTLTLNYSGNNLISVQKS